MQKIVSILLVLVVILALSACSNAASAPTQSVKPATAPSASTLEPTEAPSATTAPANEATPTPTPTVTSSTTMDKLLAEMGKFVTMTDINKKAYEMIGAFDGRGFFVGDNAFEIYQFHDKDRVAAAASGTLKLIGDSTAPCVVNGEFVMIYFNNILPDDVKAAFLAVK